MSGFVLTDAERARMAESEVMLRSARFVAEVAFKPWRYGASGPDAWDCWHLFRAFQVHVMGRAMPGYPAAARDVARLRALSKAPERALWAETQTPRLGDAVEFVRSNMPFHIGVWLPAGGGTVLHAVEGAGVVTESLFRLRAAGECCRVLTRLEAKK